MMNLPCILIPAIVGIICGILGYLIGKMGSKPDSNVQFLNIETELENYKAKLKNCQADLKEQNGYFAELSKAYELNLATGTFPFNADLAASVFGKPVLLDDLKIVEGIGPKIEELFNAAGIKTWQALSTSSIDQLQQILDAGGDRFAVHDPSTWAKQSELAFQGKWEELKKWQDELDGGKVE